MNLAALHRLLVGFTASLIAASVFSELLSVLLKRQSLRATASWTLGYAAAITPFTAVVGYLWWDSLIYPDQRRAMPHVWTGISLAILLIPLAIWRGRMAWREQVPGLAYLAMAGIFFAGSVIQSNLGRDAVIDAQLAAMPFEEDCHMHATEDDPAAPAATQPSAAAAEGTYVCPMHPDVSSDEPGRCPRCGMKLVKTGSERGLEN